MPPLCNHDESTLSVYANSCVIVQAADFSIFDMFVYTVIMSILQAVLRCQKSSRARCWTSLGSIVKYNSCTCLCIDHIAHTRSHTPTHTCMSHFCVMYSSNLSIKTQTKEVEKIFVFADFFAQYAWLNLSLSLPPSACVRACVRAPCLSLLPLSTPFLSLYSVIEGHPYGYLGYIFFLAFWTTIAAPVTPVEIGGGPFFICGRVFLCLCVLGGGHYAAYRVF
jgi:hypothetical protein